MNEYFDIKRFVDYAIKKYAENRKVYLGILLVLAAIILGEFLISIFINRFYPETKQNYVFFAGSLIQVLSGFYLIYIEMKPFRDKRLSVTGYTQPASVFEKYIYIVLNSIFIYAILCFACNLIAIYLVELIYPYDPYELNLENVVTAIYNSVFFGGFALFAATSRIKSYAFGALLASIVGFIFIFTYELVPGILSEFFFDKNYGIWFDDLFNSAKVDIRENGHCLQYYTDPVIGAFTRSRSFVWTIISMWIVLIYIVDYFRFRERRQIF